MKENIDYQKNSVFEPRFDECEEKLLDLKDVDVEMGKAFENSLEKQRRQNQEFSEAIEEVKLSMK